MYTMDNNQIRVMDVYHLKCLSFVLRTFKFLSISCFRHINNCCLLMSHFWSNLLKPKVLDELSQWTDVDDPDCGVFVCLFGLHFTFGPALCTLPLVCRGHGLPSLSMLISCAQPVSSDCPGFLCARTEVWWMLNTDGDPVGLLARVQQVGAICGISLFEDDVEVVGWDEMQVVNRGAELKEEFKANLETDGGGRLNAYICIRSVTSAIRFYLHGFRWRNPRLSFRGRPLLGTLKFELCHQPYSVLTVNTNRVLLLMSLPVINNLVHSQRSKQPPISCPQCPSQTTGSAPFPHSQSLWKRKILSTLFSFVQFTSQTRTVGFLPITPHQDALWKVFVTHCQILTS